MPALSEPRRFEVNARQSRSVDDFLTRVRETIKAAGMIAPGDRVLVAVSGGPDSVALWRVLEILGAELSCSLAMVHLNYHLRGAESDVDEQFCRELAAGSDTRVFVRSRRRPKSVGNLQNWARRVRYEVFTDLAARYNFNRIALGHQYDDQVETIVAGFSGGRDSFLFGGIPRTRGNIVRPLFDCRRDEILSFLKVIGQPYRKDTSNRDKQYLRNRVRHDVLPHWRKLFGLTIDERLFRLGVQLARQTSYLDDQAESFIARSTAGWGRGWLLLDTRRLRHCDRRLDYYILRRVAFGLSADRAAPGAEIVDRFGELVHSGETGRKLTWGRMLIENSRAAVVFILRDIKPASPVEIGLTGTTGLPDWQILVQSSQKQRTGRERISLPWGAWRMVADADYI